MKYKLDKQSETIPVLVKFVFILLILIVVMIFAWSFDYYRTNLKPLSNSSQVKLVIIKKGYTSRQIGDLLFKDRLIRSSLVFDVYIHLNSSKTLQAGTYDISPNMSVSEIVNLLASGKVVSALVTIFPGTRVDEIKQNFIKFGFTANQVNQAFNINLYKNSPIMSYVPSGTTTLEGLLWPDSFLVDASTSPQTVINESLAEMYQQITPQIRASFQREGLTVYQGITLASIIIKEVSNSSDQAQAAQVFLSRLALNMPLGSDVTALYGDAINNQPTNLSYDSPYNTLIHTGLPPSPIATISTSSLNAVANPAATSWLYFVTGDNGITYFSKTAAQQQQNTLLYCHKLCSLP